MINPISVVNNNQRAVMHKSNLSKIQDEIDAYKKKTKQVDNNLDGNESKSCIAGYAALALIILAIGATVATVIKAGKDKFAKETVENIIKQESSNGGVKKQLDLFR